MGQIARDTGWSVDYIMRGVNCPMLMLMWQDFPRHVPGRKKTTQEMVAERRSRNEQPDISPADYLQQLLDEEETLMNPIKLEIFLDDKTLAGMRSVEGNVANMEAFTRRMIGHLKLELKDLEKEYKNLQEQGLAGEREMADIQALKGAIGGLKEQLKEYEAAKTGGRDTRHRQ